ncbi:MAG: sigma-70 family RNA polymerase sigma factor, partial [Anaerotignum sp.]|nr:sigma-70 family RNA polymerase sigma factor [Anaerotignum sp.]
LSYNTEKSIRLATYASRCIENEILMTLRYSKKFQNDISLHEPIGTDRDGNEIVMLDVINSNTPDFADQLDHSIKSQKMLQAIRNRLTARERTVIILRYGLWNHNILTQQEIASRLGISRSYVSRIEKKALKKLNAALQE